MKFVFTFALILTMLLTLASLSTAKAPLDPNDEPALLQPTTGVPQGVDGPSVAAEPPAALQPNAAPEITADGWEVLAPGISYQQFRLDGPVNVYVARMDTSGTYSNTIETSLGNGKIVPDWTSIPAQFQFYDGALNTWGREANRTQPWGMTNHVLVAINGSYYDKDPNYGLYESLSGVIASGWYAKRIDPGSRGRSFAWKYNRSAFISDDIQSFQNLLLNFSAGNPMSIDGVNVSKGDNQLILYTPQYDNSTPSKQDGIEILVEMSSPTILNNASGQINGIVRSDPLSGPTLIPFNSIVLSASGTKADDLRSRISKGDSIGIAQGVTDLDPSIDWAKTYTSISGDFHFLKHGVINPYSDNKGATSFRPRTAVAYNSQYIFFIVADGDTKQSIGMNVARLGDFVLNTLQATDGLTEDSGGSSIMVVNGVIRNRPSDCRLTFLPMLNNQSSGAGGSPAPASTPTPSVVNPAFYTNCIRWVTNGLLMVQSMPKQTSPTAWSTGAKVNAISEAFIRLGPGTNYAPIATAHIGEQGTIQDDPNGLNGVWAKGYYWWKVAFPGGTGWVAEGNLAIPK